ncbi:MAG: prepilin-type N-terminal cleavage/methylation domain-containing protein [Deltaproteobacteria bacterium]|nr:prepilin-type N-terminal cleavage/methylation domain-containing protein [Deltaproteobacteria bacterium]
MKTISDRGFTFIEIILTLATLSVIAITAIPSDNGLSPFALDAAARKVKTDIRYAQNMATTTGDAYGFRVTGASTYEIYDVATDAIPLSPYTNTPMQENLEDDFGTVIFVDQASQVEFNSYGRPSLGGGSLIEISYGGDSKTIQVTATSGYVSFQ